MPQIFTERLLLMTCPLQLAKLIIIDRKKVEERSPIIIPLEWPSNELKTILPFYIEMLEKNPKMQNLLIWLIIDISSKKVIGSVRFKSIPTQSDTFDLGYEIIPTYRRKGYGFEAVCAFIHWAFLNEQVRKITAECDVANIASIKVLEKVGMCYIGREKSFLKWELYNL